MDPHPKFGPGGGVGFCAFLIDFFWPPPWANLVWNHLCPKQRLYVDMYALVWICNYLQVFTIFYYYPRLFTITYDCLQWFTFIYVISTAIYLIFTIIDNHWFDIYHYLQSFMWYLTCRGLRFIIVYPANWGGGGGGAQSVGHHGQ